MNPLDGWLVPSTPASPALTAAIQAATVVEFLSALDALRREKGLSYARLGRLAQKVHGISRSSAHAMITGRRLPDGRLVGNFLSVLKLPGSVYTQWWEQFERIRESEKTQEEPEEQEPQVLDVGPPMSVRPSWDWLASYPSEPSVPRPWPAQLAARRERPTTLEVPALRIRGLLLWLSAALTALPASAIAMSYFAMPPLYMTGFYTLVTVAVTLWTLGITGTPERPHRRKVPVDGGPLIEEPPKAAKPIIGE